MNVLSSSTSGLRVKIDIEPVHDPARARRLALLLFAGSVSAIVAPSTGVA